MIDVSVQNSIATVLLNRPEKRNALNDVMAARLLEVFKNLDKDPDCKVVVIKGSGEAFCAGADLEYLKRLQNNSLEENLKDSTNLMQMFSALYHLSKITIAQVEGPALAGGCGLAGLCDFCYSTPEALFGYTEVKIGFIPAIVSVFLSRKIGEGPARELLLTGNIISAEKALQLNMINGIVAKEAIEEHVSNFATVLSRQVSGQSIALTKALLVSFPGHTLEQQLQMAAQANAEARATADCKAGIAAFLNKEKIVW